MRKLWPQFMTILSFDLQAQRMHIHQTEILTTISHSPQVGLTKNE